MIKYPIMDIKPINIDLLSSLRGSICAGVYLPKTYQTPTVIKPDWTALFAGWMKTKTWEPEKLKAVVMQHTKKVSFKFTLLETQEDLIFFGCIELLWASL